MQATLSDVQKKDGERKDAKPVSNNLQLKKVVGDAQGFDAQSAALAPPECWVAPVQAKGAAAGDVHAAAAQGISGGGGALPHLAAIQQSFGRHDVSGVQAHTGSEAAAASQAMGAEAYATGNHVALGAGAQDVHTVAHEAAHVVQQRAGVSLSGGVGQAGDGYEQHADKVADAVVKGESAEGLLDQMSGGGGGAATQQQAIQHKTVSGGPDMQAVQEKLNKAGFDCGTPDGIAGQKTRAAIKAFQASKGLVADGVVGDKTLAALDAAISGGGAPAPAPTPTTTTPAATTPAGNTPAPAGKTTAPAGNTPAPAGNTTTPTETKTPDVKPPGEDKGGGAKTSGPVSEEERAKLDAAGRAALAALPETSAADQVGPGKVGQGDIGDSQLLPDWFMEMQNRLVASTVWGEAEEKAQHALRDYAMFIARSHAGPDGKVPAHIQVFFDYIGRGSKNDAAARKGGYKGTAALTGAAGAKNWCAGAASSANAIAKKEGRAGVLADLKARGLEPACMDTIFFSNLAQLSGSSKAKQFYGSNAYAEPLEPGDRVDYLFDGCQYGGHAVNIVAELGGAFLHVSGNTTRHSAVATGQANRLTSKPEKLNLKTACTTQTQEQRNTANQHLAGVSFGGAKLIYMIQRFTSPYKALEMLNTTDTAAMDAALKKLCLKRSPGGVQDTAGKQ